MNPASKPSLLAQLVDRVIPDGDQFIVGYADMRGLLASRYQGFEYAISFGRRLDDAIVDGIKDGPTPVYCRHYREVNQILAERASALSRLLTEKQIENMVVNPTVTPVELDQLEAAGLRHDFSHKMAATRAGLGWIGKTDLLVSRRFGPRLRLATVLLKEAPDILGKPIAKSRCGTCDDCVQACPAAAANGVAWTAGMAREEFYQAAKCRETCRRLSRRNIGEDISICGICVSVCPQGKPK